MARAAARVGAMIWWLLLCAVTQRHILHVGREDDPRVAAPAAVAGVVVLTNEGFVGFQQSGFGRL